MELPAHTWHRGVSHEPRGAAGVGADAFPGTLCKVCDFGHGTDAPFLAELAEKIRS
jgi:hypothetical protein